MDLSQVTIAATDFDASVDFYTKIGLKLIVLSEGRYARFELPSGASTLSIHQTDQQVTSGTILYFEVDDVEKRYQDLVSAGIVFETKPTLQSWRWTEARFSDPSGNKLCLMHAGLDRRFPPWRLESAAQP